MCLISPLIGSIDAFNPLSRFANIYLAAFARNLIKYSILLSWGHGHLTVLLSHKVCCRVGFENSSSVRKVYI